jgi:hypothetical protein
MRVRSCRPQVQMILEQASIGLSPVGSSSRRRRHDPVVPMNGDMVVTLNKIERYKKEKTDWIS